MTADLSTRTGTVSRSGGGSVLDTLETGQWFWLDCVDSAGKHEAELVCVVLVGSNYAKVKNAHGNSWRVHFDDFANECTPAPDAERILAGQLARQNAETRRLLQEVQDLTRRLGVAPRQGLTSGDETAALTVSTGSEPKKYTAALQKAKDTDLPSLFDKIRKSNAHAAKLMSAPLLPLQAQERTLDQAIKAVKARIFNVSLYAGLSEQVVLLTDGVPAPLAEPVRLFQRRHYMDEECLARYEAGGMEMKDIHAFDDWLVQPENRSRILPFERCLVAFQVRRKTKEREAVSLTAFLHFGRLAEMDKSTFLYLRNGEQTYRLSTMIDFDAKLFPDMDHSALDRVVYAKYFTGVENELIGEGEFEARLAECLAKEENKTKRRKRERKLRADAAAGRETRLGFYSYVKWTPDSVYYDDIAAVVKAQVDAHNRLVTVLQGLLDRSPVFHPHPPWQLWRQDSFRQAVALVYDDSRALVSGAAPDFEAYRARLNATIAKGSHTVGQEDYWLRQEARRENAKHQRDWRSRERFIPYERFKPAHDSGPGLVASVAAHAGKRCTYRWFRERARYTRYDDGQNIATAITVPDSELFNVSAYAPGDFRQFYADPRTRIDYLQWAPLMLAAEDWHAGKTAGNRPKSSRVDF